MSSSTALPSRSLRSGPPSPLLELGVPSPVLAGPSTRRRSSLLVSPVANSTPLPSRKTRPATAATSPSARTRPLASSGDDGTGKGKSRVLAPPTPTADQGHRRGHKRQTSSLSLPSPKVLARIAPTSTALAPVQDSPSKSKAAAGGSPRKPKAPEKRVLPARIRRAAGAGDGIRDLEDMIVDWLERYCEPCTTPPETLALHLTTVPHHLVEPPVTSVVPQPAEDALPKKPNHVDKKPDATEERAKIEVPTWRMATSAEDDEEEAREEILSRGLTGPAGLRSPVKRLRTVFVGHEVMEDTSEAYYISLHKKYEVFERKQRLREKEKLQYERHKMRSRVDLLRTMSIMGWTTLVGTVLARPAPPAQPQEDWERGKEKVKREGAAWLRDVLVREGVELLERYDFLLPVEARKQKGVDSRTSTPAPSSLAPTPSVSPPPMLNARVAALRDPKPANGKKRQGSPLGNSGSGSKRRRGRDPLLSASPSPSDEDEEETLPASRKVVRTYGKANGTPTIIKTRPTRPSSVVNSPSGGDGPTPTRSSRRNLLVPSKPRSNGSSISPDEIRDMREVEAAVVI